MKCLGGREEAEPQLVTRTDPRLAKCEPLIPRSRGAYTNITLSICYKGHLVKIVTFPKQFIRDASLEASSLNLMVSLIKDTECKRLRRDGCGGFAMYGKGLEKWESLHENRRGRSDDMELILTLNSSSPLRLNDSENCDDSMWCEMFTLPCCLLSS